MLTATQIKKEIAKEKSKLSVKEIFTNPNIVHLLRVCATGACEPVHRMPNVQVIFEPDKNISAYTDSRNTVINAAAPYMQSLNTNKERWEAMVGVLIHECLHILLTNFKEYKKVIDGWLAKKVEFYPKEPELLNTKLVTDKVDANPTLKNMYAKIMQSVENVLEDGYIERRVREFFSRFVEKCLKLVNREIYKMQPTLNKMCDMVLEGKQPIISVVMSKLFFYAVLQEDIVVEDELTEDQKLVVMIADKYFDMIKEEADVLLTETKASIRCEMLNRLYVKLFPLANIKLEDLKNEEQQQQDSEQEEQSSSETVSEDGKGESQQDMSEEEADKLSEQLSELTERLGSKSPTGSTNSIDEEQKDTSDTETDTAKKDIEDENFDRAFSEAVSEMAKKKAMERIEVEHEEEISTEIEEMERELTHSPIKRRGRTFMGYKLVKAGNYNERYYDECYRTVETTAKLLTSKLKHILKLKKATGSERGFMFGQRFETRDYIHHDGRYFSRIQAPDKEINVAFALLVDESGSMCGRKEENARKATILLDKVLSDLNVPYLVVGHTTPDFSVRDNCEIRMYHDFEGYRNDYKYRLPGIKARCNNNDGAAITYCCERLLKREEEKKVLIVISDGEPSEFSFYDTEPNTDTVLAIKKYREKGVVILGAIIDSYESVAEIYGKQYAFDCLDETKLINELKGIIQKYVLKG